MFLSMKWRVSGCETNKLINFSSFFFFQFQVPMSDSWDQIGVGMKVEVPNDDCDLSYPVYWIASVVKVAGMWRD